jgi:hypothetical protein
MSLPVWVSRTVRLELEDRFGALFNDALLAALEYSGADDQTFAINFGEVEDLPANFYREDRTLDSLALHNEPELPALAMWVGEGANLRLQMPRTFSGHVAAYWRFFLFVPGIRKAGLVDQREAAEAAVLAVLAQDFPTINYRGDLSWGNPVEQQVFSQDNQHFGWSQEILLTGSFEVNV